MGFLYTFPISRDEENLSILDDSLILKSYGLPYIFWGYLICTLIVIFLMYLGISSSLLKLWSSEYFLDHALVLIVFSILFFIPLVLVAAFFYEKTIVKKDLHLRLEYRLFSILYFTKTFKLRSRHSIELRHFLQSPNMAAIISMKDRTGFETKGYFELFIRDHRKDIFIIDRHSQKLELIKLKDLLHSF